MPNGNDESIVQLSVMFSDTRKDPYHNNEGDTRFYDTSGYLCGFYTRRGLIWQGSIRFPGSYWWSAVFRSHTEEGIKRKFLDLAQRVGWYVVWR